MNAANSQNSALISSSKLQYYEPIKLQITKSSTIAEGLHNTICPLKYEKSHLKRLAIGECP